MAYKYSEVYNPTELKNLANTLISELNGDYNLKNLKDIEGIKTKSIENNIKEALDKMQVGKNSTLSGDVKHLKLMLENLKSACTSIISYQSKVKELKKYQDNNKDGKYDVTIKNLKKSINTSETLIDNYLK